MNTKELRELLGKATPRPWAIYPGNNLGGDDSGGEYQQLIRNNRIHCPSDTALIVALVNNAEALLDEIERLAADRNLEKKWRKDAQDRVTDLVDCLRDWQEFAADVRASDAAGQDWLDELKARTARIVDPCS